MRPDVGRATPVARSAATIHSLGRLILALLRRPGFRRGDQRLGDLLQVAVGVEEASASAARPAPAAARRRRNGARAWSRHASRSPDGAPDRRAPRGPARRRVSDRPCRTPSAGPARAARWMNTNSPPCSGFGRGREHGPAGQHLGEARDVVLRVAAAHAERMQLEDLARQILVQPAVAIDAGDRVRARSTARCRDRTASPDGPRRRAACRRSGRAHAAGSPRARSRRPCY